MKDYIEKGFIKETVHPDYPELAIYNYTQKCQFSKAWDDTTLAARGLIMNRVTGEVIAKPWPKFFNLSEHKTIPDGEADVFEKMDGSLGIVFYYDGRWHISTRGSFTSDQANRASAWIEDYPFPIGYTHLFEIIYPENRIVVDYGAREGLVYLGSISIETDSPVRLSFWPVEARCVGRMRPEELPKHVGNAEGYVLYWPEHDFRVKMKFGEYVRLHKIISEYSIKRLWEHVSTGGNFDAMLSGVPDEFYQELEIDHKALMTAFDSVLSKSVAISSAADGFPTRREQAEYVIQQNKDLSGIVFMMLDGKDANEAIWRKVREWLNF